MIRFVCAFLVGLFAAINLLGQAKIRKLPGTINHPSFNVSAPFISADANALIFISDNAEDNALVPFYTFRDNADWREPQPMPKNTFTRMNFLYGFGLSADGKKAYYSTLKSPSVGGYDIWVSEWKGNAWADGANMAPPVNSKSHDACPSLTPDGNTMYFMRCEKMDQTKADNCKLFRVAKKLNGEWDQPVELPATINTGNSQTPRIMADGETLIFSSNKFAGNKGGMDLYSTRFKNGTWTKPESLDYVNTDKDDQYISVAALGRYLLRDTKSRKNELVEYLIPDQQRPKGMMKIEGKITDPSGAPIPAYISILDLKTNKSVYNGRPRADGSYMAYIMEGSSYELAIDPEKDNASFFSKRFDLTTDKIPQVEKVSATIKPVSPGDELILDEVKFQPYSSAVDISASSGQLRRLVRAVKANPNMKFEIQVMLNGYEEDSVQSNPDLTEVVFDSVAYTFDDIDSLGQLITRDTVVVEPTYHNDRTLQQAQSIIRYLVSQGAPESNFSFFGNAIEATAPENRKLTIKAVVKPK